MKTYVLYHSNCFDGFGAAYVAWKHFTKNNVNNVSYIPVSYKNPPPDMKPGSNVYIFDFSYGPKETLNLIKTHDQVIMLDHHNTAFKDFINETQNYADALFNVSSFVCTKAFESDSEYSSEYHNFRIDIDMNRSGAGMAWDYFNPGIERPQMINLLEDRDLWRFKFAETKEFHAGISMFEKDFSTWATAERNLEKVIEDGAILLKYQHQLVSEICSKATTEKEINGVGPYVCVNTSSHWSEVGNTLLELHPEAKFAVSYTDLPDNIRMYSLRSRGDVDVSKIAKLFGGGGHKAAAGFKLKINNLNQLG